MDIPKFLPFFLKISLPLYLIDQASKWWTVKRFSEPAKEVVHPDTGELIKYNATSDAPITVIDGIFNLTRVHNQGMAWGLGNGSNWAPVVFPIILIVAMVGIIIFWKKGGFPTLVTQIAGALVISGIIGNFTDRMLQGFFLKNYADESLFSRFTRGYVVDLFDFNIPLGGGKVYNYPCFNVADACICVAAGLLILSALFSKEYKEKTK